MMENRSFDHLLGWLKQDKNPQIDGLTGTETQPRDINDASKGSLPVTRNGYDTSPSDPKHNFNDIATQINNNNMNGFVHSSVSTGINEENPVSMFDSTTAPVINALANEFAVFDSWFCSIPTSTDPNRAFALSGTSTGVITNFNGTLWQQQSYLDYLYQHNRTVGGYFQSDLWVFGYFQDMRKPEIASTIKELDEYLYKDLAAGNMPDFTWLQPRASTISDEKLPTWQHPDAAVSEGERLIKSVYEAIRASPIWNETLFLITYDEHGGFMDVSTSVSEFRLFSD
jgi:phospholipase C